MQHRIKQRTHWAVTHGIGRAYLKVLARRGEPVAQLGIDVGQAPDIYRIIDKIRERGRLSRAGDGWITADAQIVRTIFRDNRFVTSNPNTGPPHRSFNGWPRGAIRSCSTPPSRRPS